MSSDRYPFRDIETKWQRVREDTKQFRVTEDPSRPKFYCLEMFPYPSGRIHMGHVRNYAIGDLLARYKSMRGFNVLHPMGWDAFGLPAENAAIEHGVHPAIWTSENIDYMRAQLKRLGISYDWDREVNTCEPDYYKWEQLIFIRMLERGLAYRKRSTVNWCPSCQTVLANEQVEDGRCWRCDSEVMPREVDGWFFKITAYADELLAWCDRLPGWPERVLTMQRNWIGRSEGAEFDLAVGGRPGIRIRVFTTRPDTAFGMTYAVLAPEHPLVDRIVTDAREAAAVAEFRAEVAKESEIERLAADRPKRGLRPEAETALGPVGGEPLDLRLLRHLRAELRHGGGFARVGDDPIDEGVLGREHGVGHAEGGVGACREDADPDPGATPHREVELGALAPADPVPLHREDAFGPAGKPVAPGEQLVGVRRDLEEPAVDLPWHHLGVAPPAAPVLHLLVGEDGLAGGAPVDGRALPVGEPALEHPDEDELLPPVVLGLAGVDLAVPVVGDPEPLELRSHVVDVLGGPDRGVHPVLDRRVLRGQPERVPAHRVEHVEAAHRLVTGEEITDRVVAHVTHVDAPGRVREHLQAVELGAARILGDAELLRVFPGPLPPGLDLSERIPVARHNWARVLHS